MSDLALPALTNSQLSTLPRAGRRRHAWARFLETIQLWRRRDRERRALAELSPRELADFGATTADVYAELNAPFWRSLPPKY
jgi:uncharacterized protein YjiS (DUF1127 family)